MPMQEGKYLWIDYAIITGHLGIRTLGGMEGESL